MTAPARGIEPYIHDGPPAVRRTVRDAVRLVLEFPSAVMGPLLAVQLPATTLVAIATAILYLTTFDDREVIAPGNLLLAEDGQQQFVLAILAVVDAFFTIIAITATIVAITAAAQRSPLPLAEALDPAFTRIGGLVGLALILNFGAAILVVTVIGIPVLVYLAVRLTLTFQSYMLEEAGVRQALQRSWQLTRGNMLRLAGVLALGLLAILPVFIFAFIAAGITPESRDGEIVTIVVLGILQNIVVIPAAAIIVASTTLFYLNLKAQTHDAAPA